MIGKKIVCFLRSSDKAVFGASRQIEGRNQSPQRSNARGRGGQRLLLLNPEAVIVGGNIVRAGELFFQPLRGELYKLLSYPFTDHLMILPASLGSVAPAMGAAALALEGAHLKV